MNYIKWNNAIASHFFNSEKADNHIFIYIDKSTIINIGKKHLFDFTEEEIWADYINSLRIGIPGSNGSNNLLDKAIFSYEKWKSGVKKIDGESIEFPLYLGYLSLFVVPLTFYSGEFRANSYYPILQRFTKEHNLPGLPYQNESCNWNSLWNDLEEWSILIKNIEFGAFEIPKFKIERWKYVGKPLSQCLLTIHTLNKLPELFDIAGLTPKESITNEQIKKLLLKYGESVLSLNKEVQKLISEKDDELGKSIIEIVRKLFNDWTGNTDIEDEEYSGRIKKGWTVTRLFLCLKLDTKSSFSIEYYYRLYSINEYPEDLCFNDNIHCEQQAGNWSRPISHDFVNSLELEDNFNNWKARFPDKLIRLFVPGEIYSLNHWIETNKIVRCSDMLILVHASIYSRIEGWAESCSKFEQLLLNNIPEGFQLYKFSKPTINHPDFEELNQTSDIQIILKGGIRLNHNTYLKSDMPSIELENCNGDEKVFVKYFGETEKLFLKPVKAVIPKWEITSDIKCDKEFNILIEGDNTSRFNKRIKISDGYIDSSQIKYDYLPRRNEFGRILENNDVKIYACGSIARGINYKRQIPYEGEFKPLNIVVQSTESESDCLNSVNETLLKCLSIKNHSYAKDFNELFEYIYSKKFTSEEIEKHPPLSFLKRSSLNMFDYLGYVDFEYSTGDIYINPPHLILIPAKSGRKTLLIGARTPQTLEIIRETCIRLGLHFQMKPQDNTVSNLLLPDSVIITAFGKINGVHPNTLFTTLANECSLIYNPGEFPQFALNEISGNVLEYENSLIEDTNFKDFNWTIKIFNPETLKFEKANSQQIDHNQSLVEYKLNEYTYNHRLWNNGKIYFIDKNWGRFIILNKYKKNVIFNDRKGGVLVQIENPRSMNVVREVLRVCL